MEKTYAYSYLPCQFCVGKNHCDQCGEDIRQALMRVEGVHSVAMDVPARRLTVRFEGDPGEIEEAAESLGVFL